MDFAEALVEQLLGTQKLSDINVGKSDVRLIRSILKKIDANFNPHTDAVLLDLLNTYRKRPSESGLSPELKRICLSQISQVPCSQEFIPCSQEAIIPCSQQLLSLSESQREDDAEPEENLFILPDSLLSVPSLEELSAVTLSEDQIMEDSEAVEKENSNPNVQQKPKKIPNSAKPKKKPIFSKKSKKRNPPKANVRVKKELTTQLKSVDKKGQRM